MKTSAMTPNFGLTAEFEDLEELLNFDSERLKSMLVENGVILVRCAQLIEPDHFMKFSEKVSKKFVIHGAKVRKPLSADGSVQTVTEGPDSIVLHSEMHFSPFSPDLMWFFCSLAPSHGGETTVCDGTFFFKNLSVKAKELLSKQKLKYWNLWDRDSWSKFFSGYEQAEILEIFKSKGARAWFNGKNELEFETEKWAVGIADSGEPAFANSILVHDQYSKKFQMFHTEDQTPELRHRISFSDGAEIPQWLNQELAEIEARAVYAHKWKNGDLLLLDNRRMLHGRNSFDPAIKRTIMVRMAMLS